MNSGLSSQQAILGVQGTCNRMNKFISNPEEGVIRRHRYTVDEYYRMGDSGILKQGDRVELIEGEIVDMVPVGSAHVGVVNRLNRLLVQALGDRAIVSVQNPVRLSAFSEPEPDIALLRPRDDFYSGAHPGPTNVLLIIEVSDSSLDYDRDVKLPLYARHEIPVVWLIDIQRKQLLVFRSPTREGYRDQLVFTSSEVSRVPGLEGIDVNLDGLFP